MQDFNDTSRREFIEKSLAGLLSVSILNNKTLSLLKLPERNLSDGIFISKEDIPRIRENTRNPVFQDFWKTLKENDLDADRKFLNEELDFNNHVWHLSRANELLKRSSFISLIEEDKNHEDISKLAIDKILAFNEWDYFTEAGKETIGLQRAPETTIALSWALEMMNESLTENKKEEIRTAIMKKGIPPCYNTLSGMRYPDKVKGWGFLNTSTYKYRYDLSRWPYFLKYTNLKVIPIAGLCIGSVTIGKKNPDYSKWNELAKYSIKTFVELYGKDGSYPEGVGYWGYATLYLILGINALKRYEDYNYKGLINYKGSVKYGLQLQAPFNENPGGVINFSDAGFNTDMSLAAWIANEFNDGISQYAVENYAQRRTIFALIWYNSKIKSIKPDTKMLNSRFDNSWIISRTGWGEKDTVVAFRSGGPANHEHADRNTLIVNAFGERLLHDPLGAAYSPTEKHWLLRHTEAHNGILIDGKGHQYHKGEEGTNSAKGEAKIINYKIDKNYMICTSDATHAYKLLDTDILKVQRTVIFVKPDILILIDEVKKDKNASVISARFHPFNIDGKALLEFDNAQKKYSLIRPLAKISGRSYANSEITLSKNKLDIPEDKGIYPYIEVTSEKIKDLFMVSAFVMLETGSKSEINFIDKKKLVEVGVNSKFNNLKIKIENKSTYPKIKIMKS